MKPCAAVVSHSDAIPSDVLDRVWAAVAAVYKLISLHTQVGLHCGTPGEVSSAAVAIFSLLNL